MDCSYLDLYYPTNNITTLTLPRVYIVQAAVLSVVFILSSVGMVLNIVFVCRRKTNFLVRRIVYITVITTLQLGVLWLWSIPAFKPDKSMLNFCNEVNNWYISVASSLLWTMALLICSIYFTVVTKLCGCFSRRHLWSDPFHLLLEYLFVMILLLVGLALCVLTYFTHRNFAINFTRQIIVLVIPPALALTSLIGNIVLTVWFFTLRRRRITRRRDALKEIGMFFALFFIILLVLGIDFCALFPLPQTVLSFPLSCFPLLVFGYMCYSFRSKTRHVRFANRADIETAGPGLRTAPPSTRVSLPTDTADHAPNFLSPSTAEPSEVTPLIN